MVKKNLLILIIFIWVLLCVLAFIQFWNTENAWKDPEIAQLFFLKVGILTFPSGFILTTIGYYFLEFLKLLSLDMTAVFSTKIEFLLIWLGMVVAGYLQWFWLLPKIHSNLTRKG